MTTAKTQRVGTDFTNGSILHKMIVFSLPIIAGNLIQQLYSMVDLAIIGKYIGSVGTVSVATGGELSDLMTPVAISFSTAGQIYIAQLAGEKNRQKINETAGTLITLLLSLSLVIMAITLISYRGFLSLLNCPADALSGATQYMLITAVGFPFIFAYNAICALLRGMGESKRPLMFIIVAAVANLFLDLLLVVVFQMGVAGTAIATVASQLGAFLASLFYLHSKRKIFDFSFSLSYFRIRKQAVKVILLLGIPQLVRVFSVQFSMLWVKSNINSFGLTASATYSVGNKIEKFMNIFILGMDGAAASMIAQNIGARKPERAKKVVWTALSIASSVALIVSILFLIVPRQLYGLLTNDAEVIEFGVIYLRIMILGCFTSAYASAFKSIATGSGAANLCLLVGVLDGVCRVCICLIATVFLGHQAYSYFWGAALCQLVPGTISLIYFIRGSWISKKLLSEQ